MGPKELASAAAKKIISSTKGTSGWLAKAFFVVDKAALIRERERLELRHT